MSIFSQMSIFIEKFEWNSHENWMKISREFPGSRTPAMFCPVNSLMVSDGSSVSFCNAQIRQADGINATYCRLPWKQRWAPCGFHPLLLFWTARLIPMFCIISWNPWIVFTAACSLQVSSWMMVNPIPTSSDIAMFFWVIWTDIWTWRLGPFLLLQNLVICLSYDMIWYIWYDIYDIYVSLLNFF